MKLKDGLSVPLERALAVFDMFVLHDRVGDFDEVSLENVRYSRTLQII